MDRLVKFLVVVLIAGCLVVGQDYGQAPPDYGQNQGAYNGPTQAGPNPEVTRPEQGVARLSLIDGEVSVRRGDSGDVISAVPNAPVMVQDRVMTSSSSRAEIQFDAASLLRIAANSEVRIADLQYGHVQIQLSIGTITLRVLGNGQNQLEIDLPAVGFRPSGPGVYRISVREDGSGEIAVREGSGQVLTQSGAETVQTGAMMMVRGTGADAEYQVVSAPAIDDWDRWNQQRDGAFLRSRTAQYVSPDIYGTENLDQNGRWVQDSTYGNVWAPNVQPGWAPYQDGQWVWEDYYGWTWVGAEPWAWAPYHYGRWFHGPVGWCWYPGSPYGHRYWSPALVGFFGFGGARAGIGFGFGFGNVGWVPLAPFESVHAWWGRGYGRGAIFNNTTIVRNTNITNVYRNARVVNGVTAVGAGEFGRHVGQFQRLSGSQVQGAGLVRGTLPVAPSRASLSFNGRSVNTARFPQTTNRSFFGRTSATGGAQRTPFDQQRGGWGSVNAPRGAAVAPQSSYQAPRNFAAPASNRGSFSSPSVRGSTGTTGGGWSRFNGPGVGSAQQQRSVTPPAATSYGRGGGWGSVNAPRGAAVAPQSSYQAPRSYEAPRSFQQAPRSSWGGGGSQAVRISPPIVRNYSSGNSGGNFRGGSAPASRATPAPRSSGGSGGGSHSSGGSGGHSSGGGGHHR